MATPDVDRLVPTNIQFLSAELLSLIFKQCFLDFELDEEGQPDLSDPPWHSMSTGITPSFPPSPQVDIFKRFKSSTRFPYALAAVSIFWMQVLSSEPNYWRQVIIYRDSRRRNFWDLRSFLSWSRSLPIDVIILRRNLDSANPSEDRIDETSHISRVMDSLKPHISRCRSIYIETDLSSPLPLLVPHMPVHLSKLSSLFLTCKSRDQEIHNTSWKELTSIGWRDHNLMIMPHLKSLLAKGKTLDDIYPLWLCLQGNLRQITISDYDFSHKDVTLANFLRVIRHLPYLRRLKLQNLRFSADSDLDPDSALFVLNVQKIYLEGIPSRTRRELFCLCQFPTLEEVQFTRCSVGHVPNCNTLILKDARFKHPLEDMLADWDGSSLWIDQCPGFDDSFFDTLSESRLNQLKDLWLSNLPPFKLEKLRRMVERRNGGIHYEDPDWRTKRIFRPAIKTLSIQNCAVDGTALQDIDWFASRIARFYYV